MELFTTTEVAMKLGLSRPTLMKFIASGEIAHVRVGTHHRVPAQAVLEFQRARKVRREEAARSWPSRRRRRCRAARPGLTPSS